ncbi:MAG: apolipoprotein N-acyltransferase, partial [Vampirovibrionia bacterium]
IFLSLFAITNFSFKDPQEGNLMATVIQPAYLIDDLKTGKITKNEKVETYLDLIYKAPEGLIVLPEGAYNSEFETSYDREYFYLGANLKKGPILLGTYGKLGDKSTNAVVVVENVPKMPKKMPAYHKNHLVPFGEYLPFRDYLPSFLEQLLSISAKYDFAGGKTMQPVNTSVGDIGILICFESIFPHMAKTLVNNGATILVNASNLGWFHNSIIDKQFIAICVLRAVENNRYFIVSINNGSSVIISPKGKIITSTKKNQKAFISAKIKPVTSFTFFTRWKNYE